jgi:sodium/proline symporter
MGATVAAISASASSSSAWTLLGVSGAAYLWGLPALWLFPATLAGFLINWIYVAPRLMAQSRQQGAITLTEFLAGSGDSKSRDAVLRLGSAIILFSFIFYIAAQFQAAGVAFASTFDIDMSVSVLIGAAVVLVYTLLGGFWAVSVTDTVQGLLMAVTAVLLPAVAFVAVGGWVPLGAGLVSTSATGVEIPAQGIAAVGFVAGILGIGLGYPGQPHVVNRFMALKDKGALARARLIAIAWAAIIYGGMLMLGLCGRVLYADVAGSEQILFEVSNRLLPPVIAGIMIAAVLSAIMSTADSQLLTAGSSVTNDLPGFRGDHATSLKRSRVIIFLLSVVAVTLALAVPDAIFSRVLFAWSAIGSAFGPVLILRLAGVHISSQYVFRAMLTGFSLTVILHWLPDYPDPGDAAERLLPFFAALTVALLGRSAQQTAVVD